MVFKMSLNTATDIFNNTIKQNNAAELIGIGEDELNEIKELMKQDKIKALLKFAGFGSELDGENIYGYTEERDSIFEDYLDGIDFANDLELKDIATIIDYHKQMDWTPEETIEELSILDDCEYVNKEDDEEKQISDLLKQLEDVTPRETDYYIVLHDS